MANGICGGYPGPGQVARFLDEVVADPQRPQHCPFVNQGCRGREGQ